MDHSEQLASFAVLLDAAIEVTGAVSGTILILDQDSGELRIVGHSRIPQAWLDAGSAEPGIVASRTALRRKARVVVEDVERDPIFRGAPALELLRAADVGGLQVTPLMSSDGDCLGTIATYYRHPTRVDKRAATLCDLIARHAADQLQRTRAEGELRRSEQRYRTLVESVAVFTWISPPSGMHVEPLPAWMAYTGQSGAEMLGAGWKEAVHPDDVEAVVQKWGEAIEQSILFRSEHRVRRHDGIWRWMRVTAVPLRDEKGQVTEWFGTMADITERRELEESLRASERRFRAIFENAGVGMALLDGNLRFIEVNDRLSEIVGYTKKELLRMGPQDLNHPEDRDIEAAKAAKFLDDVPGRFFQSEKRAIRKDGRIIWVRVGATTMQSDSGDFAGSFSIIEDITAQRSAETSLAESEALVRMLFDNSPVAMGVVDRDGKLVLANPAVRRLAPSVMLSSDEPTRGVRWRGTDENGLPLPLDQFPLARALRGERVVPGIEMQYSDNEGNKSWHLVQIVPLYDLNGKLNGAFGALSDVSDRKATAELLSYAPQIEKLAEVSSALAVAEAKRAFRRLTSRESEILQSLVKGRSNKEIALEFGLSPRTVEHHRSSILRKLEVQRLPQLVALWMLANPTT